MNTHIVTKRLPAGEKHYEVGSLVDASQWRTRSVLEESRYIKPIQQHQPDERVLRVGRKEKDGGNTRN